MKSIAWVPLNPQRASVARPAMRARLSETPPADRVNLGLMFGDLGRGSERTLRLPLRNCSGSHFRRSVARRVALVLSTPVAPFGSSLLSRRFLRRAAAPMTNQIRSGEKYSGHKENGIPVGVLMKAVAVFDDDRGEDLFQLLTLHLILIFSEDMIVTGS